MHQISRRQLKRNRRGAMASVLLLLTALGLLIVGSIGIDLSHAFYVKGQLQAAADNTALTGAYYLTSIAPGRADTKRSEDMARQLAARSIIDGEYLNDNGERTQLDYQCYPKPFVGPHVCEIVLTHKVGTTFGRLVGWHTLPVTVTSQAGAFMGTKTIAPNWLTNIAVSHRAGGGKLNADAKDKEMNTWFISNWPGEKNPAINIGNTRASAGTGNFTSMEVNRIYNVAVVKGGEPDKPQPTESEIIGTTSVVFTSIEGPNKATVRFAPGGLIKGQPGKIAVNGSSADIQFVQSNGHWRVALMK